MKKINLLTTKLIPFLLLIFAFTPLSFAQNNNQETAATERTVNTHSLHVRSQPWMGNNVIGYVNRGDRVGVTTEDNGWCRINYAIKANNVRVDYNNAYVYCAYLTGAAQAGTDGIGGPEEETATERTVNTYALNVRSQPWMGNNVIGYVNRGDRVGVTTEDNGWCRINYAIKANNVRVDYNNAYVYCAYLTGAAQAGTDGIGGPTPEGITERTVHTGALNVRSQPRMGNNIIGIVYAGNRVGVASEEYGWCRIDYVIFNNNNRADYDTAYVACSFLR